MFQFQQLFTKTDVANYTSETAEKMFEFDNKTFFWTKHQKALIDSSPKRVLFTSEFGTGKTALLKAKAKQLGRERHLQQLKNKSKQIQSSSGKIFFVVFTSQETLLTLSLKSELEELKEHIEIMFLTSKLASYYPTI
jgi:SpoVK/Ycf46/Vps4 family AAA+-type ATPase